MKYFDEWWQLYPRKVGKQECARIWKRKKLDNQCPEMIEHLREQVERQYSHTERQFIPHPKTYLNQGRWEDEIESIEETALDRIINDNVVDLTGRLK